MKREIRLYTDYQNIDYSAIFHEVSPNQVNGIFKVNKILEITDSCVRQLFVCINLNNIPANYQIEKCILSIPVDIRESPSSNDSNRSNVNFKVLKCFGKDNFSHVDEITVDDLNARELLIEDNDVILEVNNDKSKFHNFIIEYVSFDIGPYLNEQHNEGIKNVWFRVYFMRETTDDYGYFVYNPATYFDGITNQYLIADLEKYMDSNDPLYVYGFNNLYLENLNYDSESIYLTKQNLIGMTCILLPYLGLQTPLHKTIDFGGSMYTNLLNFSHCFALPAFCSNHQSLPINYNFRVAKVNNSYISLFHNFQFMLDIDDVNGTIIISDYIENKDIFYFVDKMDIIINDVTKTHKVFQSLNSGSIIYYDVTDEKFLWQQQNLCFELKKNGNERLLLLKVGSIIDYNVMKIRDSKVTMEYIYNTENKLVAIEQYADKCFDSMENIYTGLIEKLTITESMSDEYFERICFLEKEHKYIKYKFIIDEQNYKLCEVVESYQDDFSNNNFHYTYDFGDTSYITDENNNVKIKIADLNNYFKISYENGGIGYYEYSKNDNIITYSTLANDPIILTINSNGKIVEVYNEGTEEGFVISNEQDTNNFPLTMSKQVHKLNNIFSISEFTTEACYIREKENDECINVIGENVYKINKMKKVFSVYQTIEHDGRPKDKWKLNLFLKSKLLLDDSITIKLIFTHPLYDDDVHECCCCKFYDRYQGISLSATAKNRYTLIKILIEMKTKQAVYLGNVYLEKNMSTVVNTYNEKNKILGCDIYGNEIRYIYDETGNIDTIKSSMGERIKFVGGNFDSQIIYNDKHCSKDSVSKNDNYNTDIVIHSNYRLFHDEKIYRYDSTNEINEIIANNKTTTYNFDKTLLTNTATYPLNNNTKIIKEYKTKNGILEQIKCEKETANNEIENLFNINTRYSSTSNENIIEYQNNNLKYKFGMDCFNRLSYVDFISSKNIRVEENSYYLFDNNHTDWIETNTYSNTIQQQNIYNNKKLVSVNYNNNKALKLIYNDTSDKKYQKDLIKETKYGDVLDIQQGNYLEYLPLDNNKILGVTNVKRYEYDNNNNIIKQNNNGNEFDYFYDDLNCLQKKIIKTADSIKNVYYEYEDEMNVNNIYGFLGRLSSKSLNDYIFPSTDYRLMFGNRVLTANTPCKLNANLKRNTFSLKYDNSMIMIDTNKLNRERIENKDYNGQKFNKIAYEEMLKSSKAINLWFCLNEREDLSNLDSINNSIHLVSFCNNNNSLLIIRTNNNNQIEIYDQQNNYTYNTNIIIPTNQWNYLSVSIDNTIKVRLNNEIKNNQTILENNNNLITNISNITLGNYDNINNSGDNASITNLKYEYEIMFVSLGTDVLIKNNDLNIVGEAYKYLQNSDGLKLNNTIVYQEKLNKLKLIPLNGTFDGTIRPNEYDVLKQCSMNYNRDLFYYDPEIKRYVYCSKLDSEINSLLSYDFKLNNKAILYLRFRTTAIDADGYIISNFNDNQHLQWGITTSDNGSLKIIYYDNYSETDSIISTDIYLRKDKWYNMFIRVNDGILELTIDNETFTISNIPNISLNNCLTYIGSSVEYIDGYTKQLNNLNGFFDCIGYMDESENQLSDDDILNIEETIKPIIIQTKYDYDNRLKQDTIITKKTQLDHYYQYYEDNYINYYPTAEIFYDGELINYRYDDFNNVVSKEITNQSGDILEKYNYSYDLLNQLIKEEKFCITENGLNKLYEIDYTYDNYGNIINRTYITSDNQIVTSYTYGNTTNNNVYENVLSSITKNNKKYTYHYESLVGPSSIVEEDMTTLETNTINLEWNNKELVKYGNISFEYNENGQRIKKIVGQEITNYTYENDLLIRSTKNNVNIDYIYDIRNRLIGFTYNGKEYIYIRDMLGNINKIVDSQGTTMVKYTYTSYGEVTIENPHIQNSSNYYIAEQLIKHNVFLYKGYYYDVETNLFYVTSRYYSPELGRFIQPADVSSLNPSSINGLNLYSYANNNSIGIAYSSSNAVFGNSGGMVSSLSLGVSTSGGYLSSSTGLSIKFPTQNWVSLGIDFTASMAGSLSVLSWTFKNPEFYDFLYSAYGISKYEMLSNLKSPLTKAAKWLSYGIVAYETYDDIKGHIYAGDSLLTTISSGLVTAGVGTLNVWASSKVGLIIGAKVGSVIGGVPGFLIGTAAGVVVGIVINGIFYTEINGKSIAGHIEDGIEWFLEWIS